MQKNTEIDRILEQNKKNTHIQILVQTKQIRLHLKNFNHNSNYSGYEAQTEKQDERLLVS